MKPLTNVINVFAFALLSVSIINPVQARVSHDSDEQIARQCAARVGIAYASDNFTDEEFKKVKYCVEQMKGNV